jgi:hypothetical protein
VHMLHSVRGLPWVQNYLPLFTVQIEGLGAQAAPEFTLTPSL